MKKFLIIPAILIFIVGCGLAAKSRDIAGKADTLATSDIAAQTAVSQTTATPAVKPDFVYESKKYNFGLRAFPKDYKTKYLSDDVGVVFEKFAVPPKNPNKKDPYTNYTVRIYIVPFENVQNYKNLNDFISKKYNGYTFQFADYGTISGFFVNDTVYIDATVHFFAMSKDKSIIYDAYMKVPSKYYLFEKDAFENLIKNVVPL